MAGNHPYPLASVFTGGMRRDVDRAQLPGGSVWNLVDFVPDELGVAISGRGGWTYYSPDINATDIESIGYLPDTSKIYALVNNGGVYQIRDAAAGTVVAATSIGSGSDNPFYHRGKLIFPGWHSSVATYYTDGSNVATLSSGPTGSRVGCAYKDHTVLGNTDNKPHRVYFSAAGDPTTWDLTYGWWDTTEEITGVATTANTLLIFHRDFVERLRGTTPPPGSDMVLEPIFNDGCLNPFTIAYWNQRVIFASTRGIYMTDGNTVVDLTAEAGMKTYWASLLSTYNDAWRVAGGIYRDHYIVTLNDNNSAFIDCLCVDLNTRGMWRFSNMPGSCFLNLTSSTREKTYMGLRFPGRVAELSSLWSPSATVKHDGNSTNPAPVVETGMFRGWDRLHRRWIQSMGKQKWRFAYTDYDLRDAATDHPTMQLSYCTTPTGSYTNAGTSLPATTDYTRKRRSLNPTTGGATRTNMVGLQLAVTGPYATAKLYALETVFEPIGIGQL